MSPRAALISGCVLGVLAVVLLVLGWIGWVAFALAAVYAVLALRIAWRGRLYGPPRDVQPPWRD
jgi:hypothetical protein